MASEHRDVVERGLSIKKAGNALIRLIGGREVHPINVRLGGFWRVPARERSSGSPTSSSGRASSRWTPFAGPAGSSSRSSRRTTSSSPSHTRRTTRSSVGASRPVRGLDIAPHAYEQHFVEEQVPHSNALHSC